MISDVNPLCDRPFTSTGSCSLSQNYKSFSFLKTQYFFKKEIISKFCINKSKNSEDGIWTRITSSDVIVKGRSLCGSKPFVLIFSLSACLCEDYVYCEINSDATVLTSRWREIFFSVISRFLPFRFKTHQNLVISLVGRAWWIHSSQ